jgi:hypothetical protein
VTFRTSGVVETHVTRVASAGGQLCGQLDLTPASAGPDGLRGRPAQKNGTRNPLYINDLQHDTVAGEDITVRNASIGAAVELSRRASHRSVDG